MIAEHSPRERQQNVIKQLKNRVRNLISNSYDFGAKDQAIRFDGRANHILNEQQLEKDGGILTGR